MIVVGVPQDVGDRLLLLYKEHEGLESEVVVQDAASPDSPLHPFFNWDDSAAAHQHRLQQARQLINRVKVEVITEDRPTVRVRGFIAQQDAGGSYGTGYVSVDDVEHKTRDAAAVLASIQRDLDRLRKKYKDYSELFQSVLEQESGN